MRIARRYVLGMTISKINRFVRRYLGSAAALFLFVLSVAPVGAAIGDWHGEGYAQARLVATGTGPDGRISAGIEIVLEPGWKTYWRSPGDAGIAPLFDFSASSNIDGAPEIEFPVPHRLDDGYSVTNIFQDRVVLPATLSATDPGSPVRLVLSLDIGVCAEICIPEHYELMLDITPGEADAEAQAILAEARAALPKHSEPGVFAVDGIARAGGADKRPVFDVEIVAPDAAGAEIFVEGPADWYPAPPKLISTNGNRATFSIEFSRLGSKTPIGGNTFRVTVVSAGEAVEDIVTLD